MATTYRVHPAIGVARVGNSPDEFFIGPELLGQHPAPQGGFKDGQCRVKRQAARFRVFAHHDDGSSDEVTADTADIVWTVHLVNKKAAFPGRGNNEPPGDLAIDPGPRTLATPDGHASFDTGSIRFSGQPTTTVPLGEIRTDDKSRLLVLGGYGHSASPAGNGIGNFWGNPGWHDDISDGPVTASITLHGSGQTPAVEGAWVIVAPPKFAPHQDSVTTLYDRVLQQMVESGHTSAPTTSSYTADIQPILQRARDTRWVESVGAAHLWLDPITAQAEVDIVFSRLRTPGGGGGDMPRLHNADSALTPTQFAHMQRWKDGNYAQDWTGTPALELAVSPAGLDRSALQACVGGAFFPGIEAGGLGAGSRPILESPYTSAFRLDHSLVQAGDISAAMALPWQADFRACRFDGEYWWPVPRPDVVTTSAGTTVPWDRDVGSSEEMVAEWNRLGFVVAQGTDHVEIQHCDERSVVLLTPHLDFVDVPCGPMNMVRERPLAISFEIVSPSGPVVLEYAPGGAPNHPQLVASNLSVSVGPTAPNAVATARLWVIFRTGAPGTAIATQVVTVRDPATARSWQVTIDGNSIARTTTVSALALDRSGSMSEDRGDGQSKHDSLQQAANMFVDLMLPDDGVGIARFNEDADVLQPIVVLGDGLISDTNRQAAHDAISGNGLDPGGATSIGDGIFEARGLLDSASGFDHRALVVLTDGIENSARWISDVAGQIDAKTYAIGLGQPQNISVHSLQTIAGNNGGFLLTTGAIVGDQRFTLQKYFLQILAGINNADVVLDPDGTLNPEQVERIPFHVNDADSGIEVVLLTPEPRRIDFRLQTPNGLLIEPWMTTANPAMTFAFSDGSAFYRVTLPTQLVADRLEQAGTWHVLLTLGDPRTEPDENGPDVSVLAGRPVPAFERTTNPMNELQRRFDLAHGTVAVDPGTVPRDPESRVPYSVVVHSYSSLTLRTSIDQSAYQPGSTVTLRASLSESGIAVSDAAVWAEIDGPGGSALTVALEAGDAGWSGSFDAHEPGVYSARVRARGRTRSGVGFTRERTLTAAVWRGADQPGDPAYQPWKRPRRCWLLRFFDWLFHRKDWI